MAAVSILPVALLFAASRRSLLGTASVLALAVLVGVLTLTRSYLMLLALLVLLLVPLQRTRALVWVTVMVIASVAAVAVVQAIDPELLALSLRLEGDVTSLRADIWSYTLATLKPFDWVVGMGYGTGAWARFFAPMGLVKELQSPHNAVLEIVGQFGVAGLLVYGAIGATVVGAYFANRGEPAVAAVALAAALVMARELLAASYIFSPSILGTYFWMVFGMVLAQLPSRALRTAAPH
jgi:O-antigen ligase